MWTWILAAAAIGGGYWYWKKHHAAASPAGSSKYDVTVSKDTHDEVYGVGKFDGGKDGAADRLTGAKNPRPNVDAVIASADFVPEARQYLAANKAAYDAFKAVYIEGYNDGYATAWQGM